MGDKVNIIIDDMQAFFTRIFDFHLAFQCLFWVVIFSFFWWMSLKLLGFLNFTNTSKNFKLIVYSISLVLIVIVLLSTAYEAKRHALYSELLRAKKKPTINCNEKTIRRALKTTKKFIKKQ